MRATKRLAIVTVAAVGLALSACGGSESDEDKIKDLVKDVDEHPTSLCDHATPALLSELGGRAACIQLAKTDNATTKSTVKRVTVNGDTATAAVVDATGPSTITFRKIDGDWKVQSST
jgi:hypothetical protein